MKLLLELEAKNNALTAMVPVALWRAAKKNNSARGGPHCLLTIRARG